MIFPDKVYNILKWISVIVLPALATLYGVIGKACDIPQTDTVVIIISAVATFIGTLIGVSTVSYNKGDNKTNDGANL